MSEENTGQAPAAASESALVRLKRHASIAEIELSNPPLNLVTKQLLEQLHQALTILSNDPSVRCVVLHQGTSRAFCAGSDMREFELVRAKAVDQKILYEEYVIRQLAKLHCPTIAALDGPALGGGFELALACDIRVAAASASVGLTECLIGGLGGSGAVRLTQLVGPSRAAELLFTGKVLQAAQALEWGLVNEIASSETALQGAIKLAGKIATRGPLSNAYAKRLIAAAMDESTASALALANELQDQIFRSKDLQLGAQAFFAKASVQFEGR
jgi:enoyl-CoA hydratase/carnithine racemase